MNREELQEEIKKMQEQTRKLQEKLDEIKEEEYNKQREYKFSKKELDILLEIMRTTDYLMKSKYYCENKGWIKQKIQSYYIT